MPELPEVETVVRHLYDRFAHAVIDHVYVRLPKMIQTPIDAFSSLLQGGKIESIVRRGKYILIHFNNGYTLVSHLRMEGKYVERSHQDAPLSPHAHLSFYLQDGRRLDYEDVRTFGTFGLYQTHEVMQSPSLNKLGPEPLSLDDASWLYSRFQTVKKSIKATLLDQTIIAGIGNIYADEILFATEIHPLTRAHQLTLQQCEHMLVNMKRILTQAIHDGGTRIRSYQSGQAIDGQFILNIHAYGQEGKPCVRCHHRIHKITVVGRGTHFCPTCQHDPHLPYIIGVTGSIAAGKSTLLNLANEHGFHTLKADDIVKKLYTNKTILKRIQQNFDPTFVDNHHLNSQALLEYLTQSTAHRQRYEKWLHPLVKQAITS
jgi:formamidopyrimidine-DNA glycosylase